MEELGSDFLYQTEIKHYFNGKKFNFYQVDVLKQVVGNACGYHSAYNLLQSIELLKS